MNAARAAAVGSVLLFCLLIVVCVLYAHTTLTVEDPIEKADVIVLLGGGEGDRVFRAAELFHDGRAPVIVVAGGGDCRSNTTRLRMTGVPAAALIAECSSHTTGENAKFVAPILKGRSVQKAILVTSWYHSRRAGAVFRHEMSGVRWIVVPAYHTTEIAERPSFGDAGLVLMEYAKIAWYAVRYGIFPA